MQSSDQLVGRGSPSTADDALTGDDLARVAEAVSASSSVATLIPPFLDLLHRVTGLSCTYLTELRPEHADQLIRHVDNRGDLDIAVGVSVDWEGSLCRRALATKTFATLDAAVTFPEAPAQIELGVRGFVSVPIVGVDERVLGTLCGASSDPVAVSPRAVEVMMMLSRLVGMQWELDKRREAAVQRALDAENRLLQRATFLAEAEHQLKSPLAVIRGWSELLAKDWRQLDDDERAEAIGIVSEAAVTASGQVAQLLDEARAEVLTLQLTAGPVDVVELITTVVGQLRGTITAAHTVTNGRLEPTIIHTDRQALWQVLWHLAENAVKYSPDGGRIDLGCTRDVDGRVTIAVTDEGVGFDPEVDLFAAFTRGVPAGAAPVEGTGLGLHIVRNLVLAMGGSVTAHHRPGRGSEFRVTLPADAPTPAG